MSGNITREYTAWCATCIHWEQDGTASTLVGAKKVFRQNGWKETKLGWVCKTCLEVKHQHEKNL
jgi:hypothetical protein